MSAEVRCVEIIAVIENKLLTALLLLEFNSLKHIVNAKYKDCFFSTIQSMFHIFQPRSLRNLLPIREASPKINFIIF